MLDRRTLSACDCCAANATAARAGRCAWACSSPAASCACSWTPDNSTEIGEFDRLNETAARHATLPEVVIASGTDTGSHGLAHSCSAPCSRVSATHSGVSRSSPPKQPMPCFPVAGSTVGASTSRCWRLPARWAFTFSKFRCRGTNKARRVGPGAYLTTLIDVARVRRSLRKTEHDSRQDAYARHRLGIG